MVYALENGQEVHKNLDFLMAAQIMMVSIVWWTSKHKPKVLWTLGFY